VRAGVAVTAALLLAGCGGGDVMQVPQPDVPDTIIVTSPAFKDGHPIPRDHTCHGGGRPPELAWRGVPGEATSLALVVSDPDAPRGTFVHWVLYNLPPKDATLAGGAPAGAREADNSGGRSGWTAPCPPSGTHRYRFTVYALRDAVSGGSAQDVLDDIARQAMSQGTLTGTVAAA
jgi:Raf kinase inhibitor-like YbhB/YbcL family protein